MQYYILCALCVMGLRNVWCAVSVCMRVRVRCGVILNGTITHNDSAGACRCESLRCFNQPNVSHPRTRRTISIPCAIFNVTASLSSTSENIVPAGGQSLVAPGVGSLSSAGRGAKLPSTLISRSPSCYKIRI